LSILLSAGTRTPSWLFSPKNTGKQGEIPQKSSLSDVSAGFLGIFLRIFLFDWILSFMWCILVKKRFSWGGPLQQPQQLWYTIPKKDGNPNQDPKEEGQNGEDHKGEEAKGERTIVNYPPPKGGGLEESPS